MFDRVKMLDALQRRNDLMDRARKNFATFVAVVAQDERGRLLRLSHIHRAWHVHVDYCWSRGLYAGIQAPMNHGKSVGLVAPITAYMVGLDPTRRIKIVCNDDASAAARVQAIGRILTSTTYRRIFPQVYKGGQWTQHKIYVNRPGWAYDPSVEAKGIFSTGTGSRADVIIYDDVVDPRNTTTPELRKRVKYMFDNQWMTRLEPTGLCLAISTPWHLDDLNFDLMKRREWCFLRQWIREDCGGISQEIVAGGNRQDYPGLLEAAAGVQLSPAPH